MIVSDRYRYVFVEQPLTASTAIAAELVEHYAGRSVLRKHANYADFRARASDDEKRYRVVIGSRNPLDQIVSGYQKARIDHSGAYSDPRHFEENGGWVSAHRRRMFEYVQAGHDFEDYFLRFYGGWRVKLNQYLWCPARYDSVIRFEHLQEDFGRFLAEVSAEQQRPLPYRNKTGGKKPFESYYGPRVQRTAANVLGPSMHAWGYRLPASWEVRGAGAFNALQFQATNALARLVVNGLGVTPGHYRRLRIALGRRLAGPTRSSS